MKRKSLSYRKRKRKTLSKTYSKKRKIEQEGGGYDEEVYFIKFPQGTTGLHIRNSVAVPTDGAGATHSITCDIAVWADILSGTTTLSQAIQASSMQIDGDKSQVLRALACFDVVGLQS